MSADVTVITATIPERASLLAEMNDSIDAQSVAPAARLVAVDTDHTGPEKVLNQLAEQATTEWVFRLDDDDLLEPNHFATLAPHLTPDLDVVYSWCTVDSPFLEDACFQRDFDAVALREGNYIPSAACVRRKMWSALGGLSTDHQMAQYEDWEFWLRALSRGAVFKCIPEITWTYRLCSEWSHRSIG